ncbi:amidohydrolase family protein [Sinomonas mesophila]|uniref:amidohydrolase family protein n=1 Tax=Sinomonas mesophila TaxID=1531955 RepID=UPI001C37C21D|nr:amidohydrolase family protein [Sinomonas mesophila]
MSAPVPDLVVAHGLVVNAGGSRRAHVVVDAGRIAAVVDASEPVPAAARTIDAAGRAVIPGGIDGHCHVAQVTGRWRTLDDYATATTAALWGGTTTILDFGIPRDSSETPLEAAKAKLALAREARCDVGLHGSVIDWDETVPAQLEELAALGIRSVKLYMTNRGSTMAENDTVLKVMREMVRLDGLTYVHAEHDAMVADCTEAHADAGRIGIEHLHETRPELAEEASVREVLAMAEYTGAPVYFVHQSTPGAVDLVAEARARGLAVHSETCPHYLVLDDGVYSSRFPEWYACCPPMRSPETVAALRSRFADGSVHTVSSDHSSYDLSQKRERSDDIRQMPHGLPGVETRMPVAFTALAEAAASSSAGLAGTGGGGGADDGARLLERFVDLFAFGPARINALPGKGAIAPGFDADLVVFDPDEARTVDAAALHMGTDFSPFHGRRLRGWPQAVVAGGRVVLDDEGFHDPGPVGRYVARLGYREAENAAAPSPGPAPAPAPVLAAAFAGAERPAAAGRADSADQEA